MDYVNFKDLYYYYFNDQICKIAKVYICSHNFDHTGSWPKLWTNHSELKHLIINDCNCNLKL